MKIYPHISYTNYGSCLGSGYNDILNRYKDDEWLVFLDHDAILTTNDWYKQLKKCIENYPEGRLFSARVNRVNTVEQLAIGVDIHNHDYKYHRRIGKHLSDKYWGKCTDHSGLNQAGHFSGHFFCVNVKAIKDCGGFPVTGHELMCDNYIHIKILESGHKAFICDGIYVYHWYRYDEPVDYSRPVLKKLEKNYLENIKYEK